MQLCLYSALTTDIGGRAQLNGTLQWKVNKKILGISFYLPNIYWQHQNSLSIHSTMLFLLLRSSLLYKWFNFLTNYDNSQMTERRSYLDKVGNIAMATLHLIKFKRKAKSRCFLRPATAVCKKKANISQVEQPFTLTNTKDHPRQTIIAR